MQYELLIGSRLNIREQTQRKLWPKLKPGCVNISKIELQFKHFIGFEFKFQVDLTVRQ